MSIKEVGGIIGRRMMRNALDKDEKNSLLSVSLFGSLLTLRLCSLSDCASSLVHSDTDVMSKWTEIRGT